MCSCESGLGHPASLPAHVRRRDACGALKTETLRDAADIYGKDRVYGVSLHDYRCVPEKQPFDDFEAIDFRGSLIRD